MTATAQKVCLEALSMPRKARADLAYRLLVSLEDGPTTPELEDAWKDEAEARNEKLKTGRTTARGVKQAIREARRPGSAGKCHASE